MRILYGLKGEIMLCCIEIMNLPPNSLSLSPSSNLETGSTIISKEDKKSVESAKIAVGQQKITRSTRSQLSKEIKNQNVQTLADPRTYSLNESITLNMVSSKGVNQDNIPGFYDMLLTNEEKMKKIVEKNPWDVDISNSLDEFLGHLKRSGDVNFRVGGRILHTASHVVRVKSDVMVNDSANVRDTLQSCENEKEQDGDNENLNYQEDYQQEIMNEAYDLIENTSDSEDLKKNQKSQNKHKKGLSDEELIDAINVRENILVPTNRCLYSKIELSDLSHSLDLVIKNRLLRERKTKKKEYEHDGLNSHITNEPKNLVLPTNFIKNKEEARMFMEQMIDSTLEKIKSLYRGEPIPFYQLVDERTKDGVVHCLIYLLHLGTRKKIDLYQKIIENSDLENQSKRKKSGSDNVSIPQIEDTIYVAPINSESKFE